MGAAVGFYTGGPIGAIIGGSIGLIGSTLDMAFNDRCHYAMNCKKGWEQNCKTGECIAQEFTEETIGDYGDTDPKQIIDLQGPVKGLKTNPGTTNCRGCGGESYKNNVDNLDVHPFISESSQEPPFSLEGMVDMSKAPASSTKNELGWPRNAEYFWKNYKDPYNAISSANRQLIAKGLSPIVDNQYRNSQPFEKDAILGEAIEHHHVNKGRYAVTRSLSKHRRGIWYSKLHPRVTSSVVFAKGKTIFGRTGKTIIGKLGMFFYGLDIYDILKEAFSEDPRAMLNTIYNYEDGDFLPPPLNGKLKNGRIYYVQSIDCYVYVSCVWYGQKSIQLEFYENYGFDSFEKQYIGIGFIRSFSFNNNRLMWIRSEPLIDRSSNNCDNDDTYNP